MYVVIQKINKICREELRVRNFDSDLVGKNGTVVSLDSFPRFAGCVCFLNFNLQVGWGFTTGYDPWLGDDQVRQNQIL